MRKNGKLLTIDDYEIDTSMLGTVRAAHFLNWAAENMPGRIVTYEQLTRIANAWPRTPKRGNPEVETFRRNRMAQVKKVLRERHSRDCVSGDINGVLGVRATIDSDDVSRTTFQARARRVASAVKSLNKTGELIDPSEIKDKEHRAAIIRQLDATKSLIDPGLMKRLELPKPNGNS